jgi:AcrR family transcriptional regulator
MANEQIKAQNIELVLNKTYHLFLKHGIERVTKEMIAHESGLSRRTIDRYFTDKTDCVLQVAEWVVRNIHENMKATQSMITPTKQYYSGAEILYMYMIDLKKAFLSDHRHFELYNEYKIYIYRNCENVQQGYALFQEWIHHYNFRYQIYTIGKNDGSLSLNSNPYLKEENLCESYLEFLSVLALSFDLYPIKEIENRIDRRIYNVMALYTRNNVSSVEDTSY